MPETRFRIRWPDGSGETSYSPSLMSRRALVQLARIEAAGGAFTYLPGARVAVDGFGE
jgi:hypothetical protein